MRDADVPELDWLNKLDDEEFLEFIDQIGMCESAQAFKTTFYEWKHSFTEDIPLPQDQEDDECPLTTPDNHT